MVRAIVAAGLILVSLALVPAADAGVCRKERGCMFWDGDYHEYILYEVDTAHVEVLVVPPASPFAARDLATVDAAIDAWRGGVQALGASWFAAGFTMEDYTLGVDVPSAAAVADPEIMVLSAEYNPVLLFGIGLQTPLGVCYAQEEAFHAHGPWTQGMAQCEQGGAVCLAINTSFLLGGERTMYDLVAHEFGHCLGIGHVGDALDFDAKTVPLEDIMSYQSNEDQVHCVSTLNVRSLEGVYAGLLGQPGQLFPGDYYTMPVSQYSQVACANPSGDLLAGLGA